MAIRTQKDANGVCWKLYGQGSSGFGFDASSRPGLYDTAGSQRFYVSTTGAVVSGTIEVSGSSTFTGAANLVGGAVVTGTIAGIKRVAEAHTAGDTLTAAESGSIHTNTGAAGAVTLVLPAAVVGLEFIFHVHEAQELRIDPNGSETTSLAAAGAQGGAGKYITANAAEEFIHLRCSKAGQWQCVAVGGTWTAEP